MITHRHVAVARSPAIPRSHTSGIRSRWLERSRVAGRKRIGEALQRSILLQLMLAMALIGVAALLYLSQASQASIVQFDIAALKSQRMQVNGQNATLHAQVTQLQSLQRIDSVTVNRLHMTRPDFSATVWVAPVVPRLAPLQKVYATPAEAEQRSEPLTQITHFLRFVKSSL